MQAINCGELAGGTITINPSTFTNQGSLQASNGETLNVNGLTGNLNTAGTSGSGSQLIVGGTNWINNLGLSAATGTTLTLAGTWSSTAALNVAGGTLNLGGSFTTAGLNLAGFTNSGGTVNLTGTLNNTGATLALNATTGSWNLVGGTLTSGTLTEANGAGLVFTSSAGTLDGVTAAGGLDLASNYEAYAYVKDGLTLSNATVRLGNAIGTTYGLLYFQGTQTLGGTGTVLFGTNGNNSLDEISGGSTLTIGSGITVRGSSGSLGASYANDVIVNQGTISADGSGGLVGSFVYDQGFSGGSATYTSDAIDTSGVSNPAPQAVWQTFRYGYSPFSYSLAGLTPGASYTLALDFATAYAAAGQQQFNVGVNGTQVLTNFDIFAAAGGKDKAIQESFTATANASGQIALAFSPGSSGYAQINGIEVLSGGVPVEQIDCGQLAGGTITINPGSFTNQGTLQVDSGSVLSFSNGSGVTFAPSSQVNVEVQATTPGSFGVIAISGNAALNGTLNIVAGGGFTLNAGDSAKSSPLPATPIISFP